MEKMEKWEKNVQIFALTETIFPLEKCFKFGKFDLSDFPLKFKFLSNVNELSTFFEIYGKLKINLFISKVKYLLKSNVKMKAEN